MFIDDELEAAGRRAAHRRVADPLPLADLKREVQRRRNNMRSVGAASMVALLSIGGAGAMFAASADEVQVISAAPVQSDGSDEVAAAASESSTEEKFSSDKARSSGSYQFDAGSGEAGATWGNWWTDVEYQSGDDADAEALKAAAEADEVRIVDGKQVWIDRYEDGDGVASVSVSSLSDGKFIRLSGPASAEEQLIDIVTWGHSDDSSSDKDTDGDSYALEDDDSASSAEKDDDSASSAEKDDDSASSAQKNDDGDSPVEKDDDGDSSALKDKDGDMSADEGENSDSHEHGEEWAEHGENWVEYGEEWAEYGEKWADWAKELADEWKAEGSDHHSDDWGKWFGHSESHSGD